MKSWRQCPRLYPWANSSLPACWYWSCSSSMMNKCPPLSKLTSRSSCEIPECNNSNKKTNNCSASKLQTIQSWPSVHCFPTILKGLLKIQVNGRRRRRCVHSTLPRRKKIFKGICIHECSLSWIIFFVMFFWATIILNCMFRLFDPKHARASHLYSARKKSMESMWEKTCFNNPCKKKHMFNPCNAFNPGNVFTKKKSFHNGNQHSFKPTLIILEFLF